MSDHAETEVWLYPVSRLHCYIRLGPEKCICTVNFPAGSKEAEVVRKALQKHYEGAASAKGNEQPISTKE